MAKKTVPQTATPELCKDHPFCYALALNEWQFESNRIAIRAGQVVQLEFTPSMVVVHDALRPSPMRGTQLGVIIYSFPFPYFRSKKLSVESARLDGIVRDGMQFHLIKLLSKGKNTECTFCGKVWIEEPTTKGTRGRSFIADVFSTKEHCDHLNAHLKEVLL